MPATRILTRPEGRIAYSIEGSGPLVVCVPGMGDLRSTYRHVTPALVAAGFTVAAIDLRGHGDSDATFSAYDDVAAATDALALVDDLGRGRAVIVGNSMGAGAAVWAAAERPDAVAGIALLGPFVRNPPGDRLMNAVFRLATTGPWAGAVWTRYLPRLYPTGQPADLHRHIDAIRSSLRAPAKRRAFSATTRTDHAPAEQRLSTAACPALVIMGGADPDFADATAEAAWVAAQLGAESVVLDGIGHYPQAEDAAGTLEYLVPFAKRAHSA